MAGELAAEWIKIPDGNGNLQKVWVRDSTARRDIAQLQTDVSGKADAATTLAGYGITDAYTKTQVDGMIPSVPSAYTSNPEMDGTASPGSSTAWARGDHVHPSDTSKQDALTSSQLAAVNSGITADDLAINDASVLCTATTIPVTLLAGTTNATLGGCFYYKIGHKVHLHLAINGLTSATTTTVCNMPVGYRPIVTFASVCLGTNYTSYSRVRVQGKDSTTPGDVMVNGSGTGAMIDLEYEAFG